MIDASVRVIITRARAGRAFVHIATTALAIRLEPIVTSAFDTQIGPAAQGRIAARLCVTARASDASGPAIAVALLPRSTTCDGKQDECQVQPTMLR